jgi:hypothetical protein
MWLDIGLFNDTIATTAFVSDVAVLNTMRTDFHQIRSGKG